MLRVTVGPHNRWRGVREVLGMGTAVYSFWAGSRAANGAADGHSWAFFGLSLAIAWLWIWVAWHAIKMMRRSERSDQGPPLLSPGSWGEPDLAPPSQSPEALAEVAELEAMWRRSSRRRPAGPG
jgi:hypothetical protein